MTEFEGRREQVLTKVLRWATPVVALVLIGLTYFLGIRTERTGFVREVLDPGLKRIAQPVLNAFRGGPPKVTAFWIEVDSTGLDTLQRTLTRSAQAGWISAEAAPLVPAKVQVDGLVRNALVQLKPGPLDGVVPKQWPLQVRLPRGDTIRGMSTFDLLPVLDGAPLRTWLVQRALAEVGAPTFRDAFVEVWLNDRELALYTLHGSLDSTQLAAWGHTGAPVLWFDDELLMSAREDMEDRLFASELPSQGDWMGAPVITYRTGTTESAGTARAIAQLEQLRAGKLWASEVFATRALARCFALCDLLGAQDATGWWNLRFVADSTGRLVAVPQQAVAGTPITAIGALLSPAPIRFPAQGAGFRDHLFGDRTFFQDYIAYLDTFSTAGWMDTLFAHMAADLDVQEKIVAGEFPQAKLDRTVFEHDRTVIRQTLRPKELVLAYLDERAGVERLAVANVHALPVEVSALVAGNDTIRLPKPILLFPREREKPLSYSILNVDVPTGAPRPLHLLVNVFGLPEQRAALVRTWSSFPAN